MSINNILVVSYIYKLHSEQQSEIVQVLVSGQLDCI